MMNAETTLADLLMLNLHEYEEEVNTIVDKAVKEMTMEKTLDELEHNWKQMEFDRVPHSRTRSTVIAASEELIELLENDQVCEKKKKTGGKVLNHKVGNFTFGKKFPFL